MSTTAVSNTALTNGVDSLRKLATFAMSSSHNLQVMARNSGFSGSACSYETITRKGCTLEDLKGVEAAELLFHFTPGTSFSS